MKTKLLTTCLILCTTILVNGCGVTAPYVKNGNDFMVTIQHVNYGLVVNLTPQVRELAEKYCNKLKKKSKYTGVYRDSGVGPEEFDFTCEETEESRKIARGSSSGSGYLVSSKGLLLTNAHVVEGCNSIVVSKENSRNYNAIIMRTDSVNDLALIKLQKFISNKKVLNVPSIENGLIRKKEVELGEKILVAGFPYGEIFGDSIKVTGGMISSKVGFGNNTSQFQLDAAIQSGSSGGPVYDEYGNIIGIVVSQLDKIKIAHTTGSLPENVNFAVNANTIRQFFKFAGYQSLNSNKRKKLSNKEISKIASEQTYMVKCN